MIRALRARFRSIFDAPCFAPIVPEHCSFGVESGRVLDQAEAGDVAGSRGLIDQYSPKSAFPLYTPFDFLKMPTVRDTLIAGALALACISHGAAFALDLDALAERARTLAETDYQPPEPIPRAMRELSYDQYQGIRFKPESSLWSDADSRFKVMFFPTGLFYTHPVRINVIEGEEVKSLAFRKTDFSFSDPELEKRVPADLGYAGFRLTFPLTGEHEPNQFMVFAGASYFRGVGRDNAWGISGRGVAVDTGLPRGERFPSFVEFWLEQPAPGDSSVRFYGLLDGEDMTGAYEFVATPGDTTRLDVKAVLFPRRDIEGRLEKPQHARDW